MARPFLAISHRGNFTLTIRSVKTDRVCSEKINSVTASVYRQMFPFSPLPLHKPVSSEVLKPTCMLGFHFSDYVAKALHVYVPSTSEELNSFYPMRCSAELCDGNGVEKIGS
jgi:hypothetical protein